MTLTKEQKEEYNSIYMEELKKGTITSFDELGFKVGYSLGLKKRNNFSLKKVILLFIQSLDSKDQESILSGKQEEVVDS